MHPLVIIWWHLISLPPFHNVSWITRSLNDQRTEWGQSLYHDKWRLHLIWQWRWRNFTSSLLSLYNCLFYHNQYVSSVNNSYLSLRLRRRSCPVEGQARPGQSQSLHYLFFILAGHFSPDPKEIVPPTCTVILGRNSNTLVSYLTCLISNLLLPSLSDQTKIFNNTVRYVILPSITVWRCTTKSRTCFKNSSDISYLTCRPDHSNSMLRICHVLSGVVLFCPVMFVCLHVYENTLWQLPCAYPY